MSATVADEREEDEDACDASSFFPLVTTREFFFWISKTEQY